MVHLVIKKFLPESLNYEVLGVYSSFNSALLFKTSFEESRIDHVLGAGFLTILSLPLID